MDLREEGKRSGGRTFSARGKRRAWRTVEARRTQAVQEEKLLELHVSQEVGSNLNNVSI